MKNYINYYFNYNVEDIYFSKDKYHFSYQKSRYIFEPFYGDFNHVEILYQLNSKLIHSNKYYHALVHNKDRSPVTVIDGKVYVMIKLSEIADSKISIYDIKANDYVLVDRNLEKINKFYWSQFWQSKIDYYEEHIYSKVSRFLDILASFNYFIGLSENAISYMNSSLNREEKTKLDDVVIAHQRLTPDTTLVEFYDPVNIILDHKARDIAEFIKYSFYYNDYDLVVIQEYINKIELSKLGAHLLFSRILFPSFYFDTLEKVVQGENKDDLKKLEARIDEYQLFISDIYYILKNKYDIEKIDWLIKKM